MKRLILAAFLLLVPLPAHASIANAGSCSATATSCTLSATATGDLNVFWAYRSASTVAPTLPAGYTKIGSFATAAGGVTGVGLLYCKLASSGADTSSGTATNATAVAGLSYSGIDSPSNLSASCAGMGVAQGTTNNAKTSTTVTIGALTLLGASNWVAAFIGGSVGTCATPPTGMTSRSATGGIQALDTNGTVSSWSAQTCTITSGTWISVNFVLKAPAVANNSGPLLKRAWAFAGTSNGLTGTASTTTINLEPNTAAYPRKAVSGDLVWFAIRFPSTATFNAIADSTGGSNTWMQDKTATGANTDTFQIYHSCLSATTTSITPSFTAAQKGFQYAVVIFYNSACPSNPVDGTPVCATGIAPTTNFGSTIQAGSITTTANNDAVVQIGWDENGGDLGVNNVASAFAFGDNQIGLFADKATGGYGIQFFNQATAGAVNPGMTFVQATHDAAFASCAVAFKSGSGGSAPGTGIGVLRSQSNYNSVDNPVFQFPTSLGNAIVTTNDANGGAAMGAGADSASNTWHVVADTVAPTSDPEIVYACNINTANNLTIAYSSIHGGGVQLFTIYEISGAATSCLDTAATAANASTITATNSGASVNTVANANPAADAPSLTPGTGNTDLFLASSTMGVGPLTSSTTMVWDFPYGTGLGDNNGLTNGDGGAHSVSSSTVNATWGVAGTSTITGLMAAFQQAPSAAGTPGMNKRIKLEQLDGPGI